MRADVGDDSNVICLIASRASHGAAHFAIHSQVASQGTGMVNVHNEGYGDVLIICIYMYRDDAGSAGVTPKAVSVWLLDKRILLDPNRTVDLKPILAILEADAKQTSRLRHPGIVSVIEPLEETKSQLIWVTEEVFGSISAWSQALQAVRTSRLNICWCSLGKPYTSRLHLWVTDLFV
jgi:hypothetical protein